MTLFSSITGAPPLSATNRRIFFKLMPLLMLCYFMSFLDRTNIGLAKERLEIDLGISAAAYGLGAGLFFLAYASMEIPSNLIMAKVGARWWIFRIMITWGALSAGMAFVQGETSFYVMRILLGLAEAGLFPGIMLYMTYWFRTEIRSRAIGMFLVAICFSSIIGGPLGGALLQLDGLGGLHGWQWMFIIEGIPTIILAFFVLKYLPDRPTQARWMDKEDATKLETDLENEQQAGADASGVHSFGAVFKDKQMLLVIAIYWCHQVAIYSFIYFLPSIIKQGTNLTSLQVGLLTAVPWIAAAVGAFVGPPRAITARRSRNMVSWAHRHIHRVPGWFSGRFGDRADRVLFRRLLLLHRSTSALHPAWNPDGRGCTRGWVGTAEHHRNHRRIRRPLRDGPGRDCHR